MPQRTDDAVLRKLRPRQLTRFTPARDAKVAVVRKAIARLLVAPQLRERQRLAQRLENLRHLAVPYNQSLAEPTQCTIELTQALDNKVVVRAIVLGGAQEARLMYVEHDDRTTSRSTTQRRVVRESQVALQPHDLEVLGHDAARPRPWLRRRPRSADSRSATFTPPIAVARVDWPGNTVSPTRYNPGTAAGGIRSR